MSQLSARNITKIFANNIKVLNDVSLDIEQGDFLSIIGASGSGKSTLLTILGGIDRPTSGSVMIDGEDIAKMPERELSKLRRTKIGFVFQFFNLAPYLTVYENVMIPIMLSGKKLKDVDAKCEDLLKTLGIASYKDKLPSKLSGGEQQRVAIARGLIFEPSMILLDEPTGNLDSPNAIEIMNLLTKINKDLGTTIIQVTHSEHNANFGNKIIRITDGKILEQ